MGQEKMLELLRARLREKKLKVTPQRILVLQVLAGNSGIHMAAEDIYEVIRASYPEIGLATIYRTLQLLLEMQLVDRINLDDGCARYEIGHLFGDETKHNHHHLICKSCGHVQSFEDDLLEELECHIEKNVGFHVLDHELKFYGVCEKCRNQGK